MADLTPERLAELHRIAEAARKLAVATEQVLKAWDMDDDVSDAIDELREAALDYAAVEAGKPEFGVGVIEIEIDDQCPHCGAAHIDDPGQLLSGYIAAEWVCGTWQDGDGDVHRSGECRERQEADET